MKRYCFFIIGVCLSFIKGYSQEVFDNVTGQVAFEVDTHGSETYFQWFNVNYNNIVFRIEEAGETPESPVRVVCDFLNELDYWHRFGYPFYGNSYQVSQCTVTNGKYYRLAYYLPDVNFSYTSEHPTESLHVLFAGGRDEYREVVNETIPLRTEQIGETFSWRYYGTDEFWSSNPQQTHYTPWVQLVTNDWLYYYKIKLSM